MKIRALLALVVVLVAALVWVCMRSDGSARQPVSAAQLETEQDAASLTPLAGVALTDAAPAKGQREIQPVRAAAEAVLEANARSRSETSAIVLYGFIRPPAGKVKLDDGAWITLIDRLGEHESVDASDDGAYSISGLAPGRYRVTAGTYGGGNVKAAIELTFAESPKRFDITLQETTSLLVRVTDQLGNSLRGRGLVPVATLTEPGDWIDETTSRKNSSWGVGNFDWYGKGRATSPSDPLGKLTLDVPLPVFVSVIHHERVVATQEVLPGQTEVTFVLDLGSPLLQTGSLRAHFVDQDGKEVPDLLVRLDSDNSLPVPHSSSLYVDELSPGWYELRPHARGFEQRLLTFRIEPGVEKDLGDVVLQPEVWVSGRILSPEALGEGEGLRCDPFDPAGQPPPRGNTIYAYGANRDGSFRINGLSRGIYLLKWMGNHSESDFGPWARVIDTRQGPVEDIVVELARAVPLVLTSSIDDWESVWFRVSDKAGTPLVSSRMWSEGPQRVKLAPGDYEIEVRTGAGDRVRKPVSIGRNLVELAIP